MKNSRICLFVLLSLCVQIGVVGCSDGSGALGPFGLQLTNREEEDRAPVSETPEKPETPGEQQGGAKENRGVLLLACWFKSDITPFPLDYVSSSRGDVSLRADDSAYSGLGLSSLFFTTKLIILGKQVSLVSEHVCVALDMKKFMGSEAGDFSPKQFPNYKGSSITFVGSAVDNRSISIYYHFIGSSGLGSLTLLDYSPVHESSMFPSEPLTPPVYKYIDEGGVGKLRVYGPKNFVVPKE